MERQIVNYIKNQIEESGLNKAEHTFSAEDFCEELGMDIDSTIYALVVLFMQEKKRELNLRDENSRVIRRNDMLEELVDTVYKGNGRLKQMALVQNGLPIASNKKKSLADLRLRIKLGETDKEIMEDYGISRTTLWRWKKEMEQEDKRIKEIVKKNSKRW